ncbi:MAG: tetratricopeptide repeat protein, partial [Candidatus Zixiibacteriota bacterium]
MEPLHLSSKIVENGKEFLIQTVNEVGTGQIKTSIFENGELLDTNVIPHAEDAGTNEINNLLKSTHQEKKSEMEYLFKSYKEIIQTGQPKMMYHLGTSLYYKKLYFEAQQLFRTAIKLDENYHEAYLFLAKTNIALNHYEDAIDAADKAVSLKSEYADYRNILGEAFLGAQSCKRAVVEFEKAISSNVYYADAYLNLALANMLNGINREDYELSSDMTTKCVDYLKKAALIYPEYQSEFFNRGLSLL